MNDNPFKELNVRLERIENLILSNDSGKSETNETLNLWEGDDVKEDTRHRHFDSRRREFPRRAVIGRSFTTGELKMASGRCQPAGECRASFNRQADTCRSPQMSESFE